MKTRFLSVLLIAVMLLTASPAEVFATVSSDDAPGQEEVQKYSLQEMKVVEISDEAAEEIGIVSTEDLSADGELQFESNVYGSQVYNTSWDAYSSNYIYNRLGAKERKLWDLLDAESRKYLTSTANAKKQRVLNKTTGFTDTYYATEGVEFLTLGLTPDKAGNIYLMFGYANPQYYFLDSGYLRSANAIFPMIYDKFAIGSERKAETAKMKTQINKMKEEVEEGETDLEKAKIAHDLVIRKVYYDHQYNTMIPNTPYHQSAYSVFCDSYTVCAGYTKAFSILMNSVGIDAIGVTSLWVTGMDISGRETTSGHAWNTICLNDSWYNVDLTWDDQDGEGGREEIYTWFGLSKSTLTEKMDRTPAHREQSMYSGLTPKCTIDLGSTQDKIGTLTAAERVTEAPRIAQKKTASGIKVTLTTGTSGADIYYTTDGQDPSSSFTRSYHYTEPFTVHANVTLKAVAVCNKRKDSEITTARVQGKQYTVKFNANGGSKVSAKKVWPQEKVSKPANPKRRNYQFAGWYSNKNCTEKWNFNRDAVSGNITLYAKWTKVKVGDSAVKKLKKRSGSKLDVTIRKVSDAKGYQIQYSVNSNMKSSKKVLTKSTKKTISGLKSGRKYYVQVRAYRLDSAKKKVYGKWSKTKAVTIRK